MLLLGLGFRRPVERRERRKRSLLIGVGNSHMLLDVCHVLIGNVLITLFA